jgi:hypothetical protein
MAPPPPPLRPPLSSHPSSQAIFGVISGARGFPPSYVILSGRPLTQMAILGIFGLWPAKVFPLDSLSIWWYGGVMAKGKTIYLGNNKVCKHSIDFSVRHKVGDRVVCIDENAGIRKGQEYIVSGLRSDTMSDICDITDLNGNEIFPSFYHWRFKKVTEQMNTENKTKTTLEVQITATQSASKQEVFTWKQIQKKPGVYRNVLDLNPDYFIVVTPHLEVFYADKFNSIQVALNSVHNEKSYVLYDGTVSLSFSNKKV